MVEYSLSRKMVGDISERCLRCYKEQYWFGENFLFNYISEDNIKGKIGTFRIKDGRLIQKLNMYKVSDKKFIKY